MYDFKFFDSHSHLNLSEFDVDRVDVIKRIEENNTGTITVGVDRETSLRAVDISKQSKNIFACIGQHPVDTIEIFDYAFYKDLAMQEKVVAIGECGLDYFRGADEKEKLRQKEIFIQHIELALETDKPLMLHVRPTTGTMDAYEDVLGILEGYRSKHGEKLKGNSHFFVGNIDIAKRFIKLDFTFSFPGVITFTHDYDEVIRYIPLNLILSETDSPFVAPVPYRGKRNEPAYVSEVVKKIVEIRGEDEEIIRLAVVQNARRAFDL